MRRNLRALTPYVYLVPSLVLLGAFTYYPILRSLYVSFFDWNLFSPRPVYAGLANYRYLLQDPTFHLVLRNTLVYVAVTIPVTMALALITAVLLNERLGWLRDVYRVAAFYPTMVPMAAAGMLWVLLLNPSIGLVNHYLGYLGVRRIDWLYDMNWALPAIMLASVWKNYGYFMLIYLAGLQNIPSSLYEAADIEGAGFWHKLRYVTLPLVAPTTVFVFVVAIISSFQVFDLVYVMTQGGPGDRTNVLVYFIYQYAFRFGDWGMASALTVLFVAGLLVVILLVMRMVERRVHYEV
ncbi:MAG: sugar ABC transporter permease [Bacillota bacterium]|nr:sugar ABC transporter permease [Bacillota bacterium]REJ34610.1 MAG: sugar ABC transporter permease [Bacillota bacterium]